MAKNELYATEALSAERKRRGINQQEMADLLSIKLGHNVSRSLYQKWEQGEKPVNTDDALSISRELDIAIKELWRAK
jgi:transcriptional regulator with XRE-family HTH domain